MVTGKRVYGTGGLPTQHGLRQLYCPACIASRQSRLSPRQCRLASITAGAHAIGEPASHQSQTAPSCRSPHPLTSKRRHGMLCVADPVQQHT